MFPGQGAQFVGMCSEVCKDVPAAQKLFDEASEILGYDLLKVCTEGPKEKLDSTVVSQPAIFVASMAAVEKLKQEAGQEALDAATCAMGLSLGEYSALCFAGAISFADGVKITKVRGEAMQAASDAVDSGMVSVIGLDSDKVKELCQAASEKSGAKIQIANYLCKGNYAVSGATSACETVAEIGKSEFKARMTVKLAVAGAFHTEFMKPAVPSLERVLEEITISKPRIPVISNVDAKPHSDPAVIKQLLATQVTSPVLWENTINTILAKDFEKAYELGPGKVTAGILKRFSKTAEVINVEV
jgi:[acyl-carrier-protein] S-malonyltransferase